MLEGAAPPEGDKEKMPAALKETPEAAANFRS